MIVSLEHLGVLQPSRAGAQASLLWLHGPWYGACSVRIWVLLLSCCHEWLFVCHWGIRSGCEVLLLQNGWGEEGRLWEMGEAREGQPYQTGRIAGCDEAGKMKGFNQDGGLLTRYYQVVMYGTWLGCPAFS